MKKLLFLIYLLFTSTVLANSGIVYFTENFGHIHENASKHSSSLTTIACGFPLKLNSQKESSDADWYFVTAGSASGYIYKGHTSLKRPECFQAKYSKFFDALEFDLGELYYWGRLSDLIITGTSSTQ